MKSAVETLNPTRVKLTVEVPFEELKSSMDAAYKTISSQVNVPGFRRGHIPPRIIDQRLGRGVVIEEAVTSALPGLYAQAVQETDVRPLGQPEVDVTDVPDPRSGGDLRFTAEVDVRPQFTLPPLDAVAVTVDDATVTDADVDERLDALRSRFGSLTTVDRPAGTGDFVTLDISATVDGEEVDSVKGVSYEVGSDSLLPGLDEAVITLGAQETTTFDTPLTGHRAGEIGHVTVTVQSVKERLLPEADDDFADLASEFETLAELRADLRAKAEQSARFVQGLQARDRLVEVLLASVNIPVPDGVVAAEVERHLEAEGRQEDAEHRAEVEGEARQSLAAQLLLDAIWEQERTPITQDEVVHYMVTSAQQMGMTPDDFVKAVESAGQMSSLMAEIARRKTLATVLQRAVITDASGRPVRLADSADSGSEAVPTADASAPGFVVPAADDPTAISMPLLGATFDEPEAR